jgi:hypothetical protein
MGISGLSLGSLGTKNNLDVAHVENYIIYYKGEGGGFPQIWAVVSLGSPSCSWLVLARKVLQLRCTPNSLRDSNVSPKLKTIEE